MYPAMYRQNVCLGVIPAIDLYNENSRNGAFPPVRYYTCNIMIIYGNYVTPLYTENVVGSSPSSPTIFARPPGERPASIRNRNIHHAASFDPASSLHAIRSFFRRHDHASSADAVAAGGDGRQRLFTLASRRQSGEAGRPDTQ